VILRGKYNGAKPATEAMGWGIRKCTGFRRQVNPRRVSRALAEAERRRWWTSGQHSGTTQEEWGGDAV